MGTAVAVVVFARGPGKVPGAFRVQRHTEFRPVAWVVTPLPWAHGPFRAHFSALNDNHVRYVVVGGLAGVLHGFARLTADIEMIVDLGPPEARRAVRTSAFALAPRRRLPVRRSARSSRVVRRERDASHVAVGSDQPDARSRSLRRVSH